MAITPAELTNHSSPPIPTSMRVLAVPLLLLLLYVAQCLWFINTQSLTYDEPVHIAEGLDAWRNGRFQFYNDHPPLARLLLTLPLRSDKWQMQVETLEQGFRVTNLASDPQAIALRARIVNVCLGSALGTLLWIAARKLFSAAAANFVLALFAFSPSLIAHFSLATTDGAATLMVFATASMLVAWRRKPSLTSTELMGVVLGLLLLAKFSTATAFLLSLAWILVSAPGGMVSNPLKWNWAKAALSVATACLVVWAGYLFHVSHLSIHSGNLIAAFPNWTQPILKSGVQGPDLNLSIPAGEYWEGLREVARHNRAGQPAFFLGETSHTGGWKLYYPVTMLLKWPTLVLPLSLVGGWLLVSKRVKVSSDLWIMLTFPAIYFAMAMFARFNIGERHLLPMYPFALLTAGAVWQQFCGSKKGLLLLTLLLITHVADTIRSAPQYLSYFNLSIRPSSAVRLLSDSNLDWGQGLLALRRYQSGHAGQLIYLAYFGSVSPASYGIHAIPLSETERPANAIVIVSATNLTGQFLHNPQAYRWLLRYPPEEIIDGCLFVFHTPANP